jgi:CO/xanthine dehydrogenase FAD-binding subunit
MNPFAYVRAHEPQLAIDAIAGASSARFLAGAYELLFSFASPAEKNEFLNLIRSNDDMGND